MEIALLAQAQDGSAPGLGNLLLPLLLIWGIFYFLVFRPRSKEQKALRLKLTELKKGDLVRTRGGLIGTVASKEEREVVLRIDTDGKVRARFALDAIEEVLGGDADEKDKN